MCNLSEGIYDNGFVDGEKQGIEKGIEKGIEQGIERGISQGRLIEIIDSVTEGDYSLERGAEKSGLSVESFATKMKEFGRVVPV